MQTRLDPIALLERTDKWYLGGGKAAMYAPAFPAYLDTPGFWDEAYFADIRLERLYCLLLLDAQGRPLTLRRALRRWTPDRLTLLYTVEGHPGLRVQEERVVTPDDTLASRLTLTNSGAQPLRLHLILWSLQAQRALNPGEAGTTVTSIEQHPDALTFAHQIAYGPTADTPAEVYGWGEPEQGRPSPYRLPSTVYPLISVCLGASRAPDSWTVNLAETTETAPLWQLSVLPEKFRDGALPCELKSEAGWNPNGMVHLLLHYALDVAPGNSETITCGASLALDRDTALRNLRADMAHNVSDRSRDNWQHYFASVPHFTCSDPYLERIYWYRWYGLRLLTVNVGAGRLPHPCIFEGIGAFRSHTSYSAQCHIRETAWMHDPALARGCLENFLTNQIQSDQTRGDQTGDGFLPGHLYLARQERGFYHANWGAAAKQIYSLTQDLDFVRRVYPALVRYAEYFDRERDREGVGLYDVVDQGETGQEYMSRYLFVDRAADAWRPIQVKGVDATCYLYELQRALACFARALGNRADAEWWDEKANATQQAVRELMWDPEAGWYKDVHPQTLARSPFKAAVGFYPFMSDIATTLHLSPLRLHLHDPATFGTPFPIPASSADDPYFAADAEWKSKRTNCPWNGRVWPMTNSHVADALAHAGRTLSADFRAEAADFIQQFVRMLFHDGDPKRPNSYEHYNPHTGTPSLYRGIDDYQHSWIVDLILRHVVGVQSSLESDGILVLDPLPFEVAQFRAEDIRVRGHRIDVDWNEATGFVVFVDGKERARAAMRRRIEISL